MIHNTQRVASIRTRAKIEIARTTQLQAKIKKGELPILTVAHNQLDDIETFWLTQLERESRTPQEEAVWLDQAEKTLQIWTAELNRIEEHFKGAGPIEIIGY